jgi:hypothetical protein
MIECAKDSGHYLGQMPYEHATTLSAAAIGNRSRRMMNVRKSLDTAAPSGRPQPEGRAASHFRRLQGPCRVVADFLPAARYQRCMVQFTATSSATSLRPRFAR